MTDRRRVPAAFLVAALVALASYANAFSPPQGGSGGGGVSNPLTADLDAGGKNITNVVEIRGPSDDTFVIHGGTNNPLALGVETAGQAVCVEGTTPLAFGGTSSTHPALRYGSSAGVIELLRADASSSTVTQRYGASGASIAWSTQIYAASADGTGNLTVDNDGVSMVSDTSVDLTYGESATTAHVASRGVTIAGSNPTLALKDVTSAPTVTAGYTGVYSLNTNGLQQLTVKGGTGAVTLATQGYYAGGGHFIVSKNADQTFSNAGETVTWTTETTDQPGGVDVSGYNTRVFTAPAAGVVTVVFKARAAVDTDPFDLIVKRFNSSDTEQTGIGDRDDSWFQGDGTNAFTVTCTVIRHMDAGDYLTLQVFTPSGITPSGIDLDDGGSNATRAAVAAGFFVPD